MGESTIESERTVEGEQRTIRTKEAMLSILTNKGAIYKFFFFFFFFLHRSWIETKIETGSFWKRCEKWSVFKRNDTVSLQNRIDLKMATHAGTKLPG